MGAFWGQLGKLWKRLETPQRASIVIIGVVFVVIISSLFYGATRAEYELLVGGVNRARIYEIVAFLDEEGVDYRITDRETSILVPKGQRYRLIKQLSDQELLSDGSTGFELLAESSFSDSSFMEQKKYDRAVAGELERIFREFEGVTGAKVIIQRAAPSPFLTDEPRSSATVKLEMATAKKLTQRQVDGIIYLCAGAVEGLEAKDVQVADGRGLVTRPASDPGAINASDEMEAEVARESYLMRKAQEILDRSLGIGRALVTVSVDLDFTERSETTNTPLQNPVVARQRSIETDESTPVRVGAGVVGTAANVEQALEGVNQDVPNATKTSADSEQSYVVGSKLETVQHERGRIRGMSVSIIADYKEEKSTVGKSGDEVEEKEELVWQAREAEELKKLEEAVLNAIGFYAARGVQESMDPAGNVAARFTSTIECIEFPRESIAEPVQAGLLAQESFQIYFKYGMAAVVGLGLLLIARGQLKRSHLAWQEQRRKKVEEARELIKQSEAAVETVDQEMAHREQFKKSLRERIRNNPNAAAQVLKNWLYD